MKGWKWKGVQFRPTENVQSQFALSYLLIIAAVLILLNTYPLLACQTLVFQAKQSILTEAQMIASNLAELGELGESGVEQVMTLVGDSNLTRIVVTDSDAQLLYDTQESARPHRYALFQELTQALDGQDVYHASFRDNAFRSEAAVPVIYCGNTIGGVYLYKYDTEQAEILLGLQSNLRNITLVVCVFAVLVSVILSRMMTRRMNDLLAAIRAFHSGSDTQPISVKGKDQLAKMADEFNQLTERIQETDAMRRQFVADASHELKTPLTSIRLLSDSILQDPEMEPELICWGHWPRSPAAEPHHRGTALPNPAGSRHSGAVWRYRRVRPGALCHPSAAAPGGGQGHRAPLSAGVQLPGAHLRGQHGTHRQQPHRKRHQVQHPRRQRVDPSGYHSGGRGVHRRRHRHRHPAGGTGKGL